MSLKEANISEAIFQDSLDEVTVREVGNDAHPYGRNGESEDGSMGGGAPQPEFSPDSI